MNMWHFVIWKKLNDCWWEQVVRGEEDAHIKRTGYGYRRKKKIQQTITIVCLLLSPTFLLHENKVRDQLCNKHVHRNDHCWRLPLGTCLGQWSLFTSLSYTLRYSPTKWRTYIYIFTILQGDAKLMSWLNEQTYMYSLLYMLMRQLHYSPTNRRTCIHHFTAAATGQDVFDVVAAAGQKKVKSTLWSFQQHRQLLVRAGKG